MDTLFGLLSSSWTAGNTNNRTPKFYKAKHGWRANWETQDVVLIYDKAYNDRDVGIMHAHTTFEHHASVEVRSPKGRRQVKRMKAEVDRIINGVTNATTSYVEYDSSSSYTAADWNYDEIEKAGANIPYDGKDGTRMVLEYRCLKFYRVHQT